MPVRPSLVVALLLVTACAVDDGPVLDDEDRALVGGQVTFDAPAVGQLLRGADPVIAEQHCTATLIGPRTLLTAAHCVCADEVVDPRCEHLEMTAFFQHAGFVEVDHATVDPRYSGETSSVSIHDVAVVHLASPVAGIAPLPIAEARTTAAAVSAVGYGRIGEAAGGHGLKRQGQLAVRACTGKEDDAWHLCLGGPAALCNGDSGGPLVADGAIVGVSSLKNRDAPCVTGGVGASVPASHDFIVAEAGADLGGHGEGLRVDGRGVEVVEVVASIVAGDPTVKAIDVPVGTTELRVAINGTSEELTDADLLVQRGAPPSIEGGVACESIEESSQGFCAFADPEPGTYYAMVAMGRGKGAEVQLTATLFGEGGRASGVDHADGAIVSGCSADGRGGLLALMIVVLAALRLRRR